MHDGAPGGNRYIPRRARKGAMRFNLGVYATGALLAGSLVAGYIAWSVGAADVLRLLAYASWPYIILYLLASVLIATFLTLKWRVVLDAQGAHVPFHRLFAYRLVGYSVNYLTPTMHVGSEPIRAYLLHREGVPTHKAISNVIIDKSVELLTDVTFFAIGALVILNSVAVSETAKTVVLAVSLLLALLMGGFVIGILARGSMFVWIFRTLRLDRITRLRSAERSLRRVERGVEEFYRKRPRHFLALVGLMVLLWGLMWFEYWSLLRFLGHAASPLQILLILTGVGIAYSLPVPAAMGTLELGQISAAKVLKLGSVTGVTLSIIIRTRDLLWTALGLGFMGWYAFRFKALARKTSAIDKDFREGDLLEKGK